MKKLRFSFRVAGFIAIMVIYWIGLELDFLLRRKPRIEIINKWVPRWSRTNLWLFGVYVSLDGENIEPGQIYPGKGKNGVGRVFIANHRSGLDIPILLMSAEAHAISRHDLADWPLIGPGARRVGTLFVDRESRKSGATVLKEIAKALDRGEGVGMFPEGTSYTGDEVREFRAGAFNAARRAGAEIVPIGIAYGSDEAYYYRQAFMEHIQQIGSLPRLDVAVEVGTPICPACYEKLSNLELREQARQQVQELVNKARKRVESA